jgi:hypothetical protein
MKLNFYNIFLSLGLSVIASAAFSAASAQDAQYPNPSFENFSDSSIIDKDKILVSLGEPEPRHKVAKDSLTNPSKSQATRAIRPSEANKAAVAKTDQEEDAKEEAEDDSILSFNFLYYIFQKYKLQDIVD